MAVVVKQALQAEARTLPWRRGKARQQVIEQALAHAEAPTKLYATETCVICLEELSAAEAQPLRCGHTYHAACIAEWCSRAGVNPRCPTCMQPIHWQRAATEAALLVQ